MAKHIFKIKGMHCASCASIITKKVSALPNINNISVNYVNEKAEIDFDTSVISVDTINQEINKLGYSLISESKTNESLNLNLVTKAEDDELLELQQKTHFILPVTFIVFVLMMWDIFSRIISWVPNLPIPMELFNIISMILATVALFWIGKPYCIHICNPKTHKTRYSI